MEHERRLISSIKVLFTSLALKNLHIMERALHVVAYPFLVLV